MVHCLLVPKSHLKPDEYYNKVLEKVDGSSSSIPDVVSASYTTADNTKIAYQTLIEIFPQLINVAPK